MRISVPVFGTTKISLYIGIFLNARHDCSEVSGSIDYPRKTQQSIE